MLSGPLLVLVPYHECETSHPITLFFLEKKCRSNYGGTLSRQKGERVT